MSNETVTQRRRYWWRLALLLLIVLLFLPEITIRGIAEFAKLNGCVVDQICTIAGTNVSDAIGRAFSGLLNVELLFAWFYLPWLLLFYLLINLGWTELVDRLCLALPVTWIFVHLPRAPWSAIERLTNGECRPDASGGEVCKIFGGEVKGANEAFLLRFFDDLDNARVSPALYAAAAYLFVVFVLSVFRALKAGRH